MKFTTEQQKEIAKYAIDNDNNYKIAGEKYDISYQQVAAWVRKFKDELAEPAKVKKTTKKASTKATSKKATTKIAPAKKAPAKKNTKAKTTPKKAANKKVAKNVESTKQSKSDDSSSASTLDVLSRRDPVLEKQLEEVKRRLGLIK